MSTETKEMAEQKVESQPVTLEEPKTVHEVQPVADIFETSDNYQIVAEVPGVKQEDISLRIENDALHLSARSTAANSAVKKPFNQLHYLRSFRLGRQIDRENINAELSHGVLRITLAKVQQAQPRTIEVRVGEGAKN